MRFVRGALWLGLALAAGMAAGELISRSAWCRRAIAGEDASETKLGTASHHEVVPNEEIDHEMDLLRFQFGDEQAWTNALGANELTTASLREKIAAQLQERRWIEKQIAPGLAVTADEVRSFYEAHQQQFVEPARYRVSHLFLAAPEGSAEEIFAAKRSAIQGLAVRLLAGERLSDLIAEASEDEATKKLGGDLGYFSEERMPPEFCAEVEKLQVGQISAPIQSHLGYHIVQLTERKRARARNLAEATAEISSLLTNEKRARGVAQLTVDSTPR